MASQEEVRQDLWAEIKEEEMNLGKREMPEKMEKKQEVQDGREVKSHETKYILL